jgi:hypothetical protein
MTAATTTKSPQHLLEALVRTTATGDGNASAGGGVQGIQVSTGLSVTVPSITDPDIAKVDVTLTGVAVGDVVLAAPTQALPTNCRWQSAYVSATDTITFVFGSEGGNVTGAAKTFDVIVLIRA